MASKAFQAGRLKNFIPAWKELTSDEEVLDWAEHLHIEFVENSPPIQNGRPRVIQFNQVESKILDLEIQKLLDKGVVIESTHTEGEFISPIFLRLKKNGVDYRLILNLKELNKFVVYKHFKMDSLKSVTDLMTQGCFMASADIKDAYYTVPIAREHQKFLRFSWRDKLYQYTCLPNGLASAPRVFTKLLKPVFTVLREKGFLSSSYIDDCYLQGDSYKECLDNAIQTVSLLKKLGFYINEEKSILTPSQKLTYLGFELNSLNMTVKLTDSRITKLKLACKKLLEKGQSSIQNLAEVIGLIVSSFPGVEYGPLYYRSLEQDKTQALRENKGNFSGLVILSEQSISDLMWWMHNVSSSSKPISHQEPDITLQTDASMQGWGGVRREQKTGGRWSEEEALHHINYLELLAILLAIKSLCANCSESHIRIECDNTTAVCYINSMGGSRSQECNSITKEIWNYCIQHNLWLSATHLPGCENTEADAESRQFNDRTEWMLDPEIFNLITLKLGNPDIDLFASRLNKQCSSYASWRPDPEAQFVDAFSANWSNFYFYAFPPFSLIGKCLDKIQANMAEGILIVPLWASQCWYPKLLRLLVEPPLVIPHMRTLLTLPGTQQLHPLREKLNLLACHLCGEHTRTEAFLKKLQTLSYSHGDSHHKSSMTHMSRNGFCSVLKGKLIQFNQL